MGTTHALRRTSPKGGPFIGTCYLCGRTGLAMGAALDPCPNVAGLSKSETILLALQDDTGAAING